MRIFVTGGTGYIGPAVIGDMLAAGHEVVGLARSAEGEAKVRELGAEPLRGDMADHDSLRRGAERSDAVAHLSFGSFSQDMSVNIENGRLEAAAMKAMGEVLAGSGKPFVASSGCGLIAHGQLLTEDMPRPTDEGLFRVSEQVVATLLADGVKAMIVRIPQVNGPRNHGFVPLVISIAREKGYAAYVGDGNNRWPAAYVDDAARVYRLAIEKGRSGRIYHAVAEEGVRVRDIMGLIAEKLGIPLRSIAPEEAADYFGTFAMFAQMDNPVSSAITRAELGWEPTGPTTLEGLRSGDYFDQH